VISFFQKKCFYHTYKNYSRSDLTKKFAIYCWKNNFVAVKTLLEIFFVGTKFGTRIGDIYVTITEPDMVNELDNSCKKDYYRGHLLHFIRSLEIFKLVEDFIESIYLWLIDKNNECVYDK